MAGYLATTIVCLGFAGCGAGVVGSSSTTTESSPSNVSVALTVASPSVLLGKSTTLTATVSNAANSAVNWSVQNVPGGNTTVGTIVSTTNNGAIFTAPQFMPLPAIVAIRATSAADPTRTGTVNITITSDVAVTIAAGTSAVELGAPLSFQATITSAGNPATAVLWSVGGAGCSGAACGAINSGGVFTAPQSLPSPPSVTLTATSVADPAKSSTTIITISSHFALTISALSSISSGIAAGGSVDFAAALVPVTGSNPSAAIFWSLSGTGCVAAACGSLFPTASSAMTTYVAPAFAPSPALVTITATAVADPSKLASLAISINPGVGVTVSPTAVTVALGDSINFTGTVTGATNTNVDWDVNGIVGGNTTLGTVSSSVGNTGQALYTAPINVPAANPVAVHAHSSANPAATATAIVTIGSQTISVSLAPGAAVLSVNYRQTFRAQVQNSSNTGIGWQVNGIPGGNIFVGQICVVASNPCQSITPATSSTVDYLAPAAVPSPDPVTVTAASLADPTKSSSSLVTVLPHVVVSVSPPSITLAPGEIQAFAANVAGTSNQQVTWNVLGNSCTGAGAPCGTVDATGLYTAPAVAPSPNTLSVSATSSEDVSRSASASVTITTGPVVLSLLPSSATAGAAGFTLSIAGANFTATNSGPGSTVLIAGRTRSTLCQSAANCSVTLSSSDLATASNFNVVVQNPNGATSNVVSFIVAAPPSTATSIALTPGAPSATGKDIVVIDLSMDGSSAPQTSNLSVGAIGVYQAATGTCSLNGGPIEILRPAFGVASANICVFSLAGLDPFYTYTLTGPSPNDVQIISTNSLGFGIVQLTLTIPSTALTGARSLFIQNPNLDVAAASGVLEIE